MVVTPRTRMGDAGTVLAAWPERKYGLGMVQLLFEQRKSKEKERKERKKKEGKRKRKRKKKWPRGFVGKFRLQNLNLEFDEF